MSEWRPIETAPKDGTIILGYDPEGVEVPSRTAPMARSYIFAALLILFGGVFGYEIGAERTKDQCAALSDREERG